MEIYGLTPADISLLQQKFENNVKILTTTFQTKYSNLIGLNVTDTIIVYPEEKKKEESSGRFALVAVLLVVIIGAVLFVLYFYCRRPKVKKNEKLVFEGFEFGDEDGPTDERYMEQIDDDVSSDDDDIEIEMSATK